MTPAEIPKPDGYDKNVVPMAAGVTACGIFVFLAIVFSYYFFCRKERPEEQTEVGDVIGTAVAADGRVRITGMNPRFGDLSTALNE